MATRDRLHQPARRALENDGWTITHDPLVVPFGTTFTEIDLGAEQIIAAEKAGRRIAVEVKSFLGKSLVSDFHVALGQYLTYHEALRLAEPDRRLYLAVSQAAWQTFFAQDIVQTIIEQHKVNIIVFDAKSERVTLWKN